MNVVKYLGHWITVVSFIKNFSFPINSEFHVASHYYFASFWIYFFIGLVFWNSLLLDLASKISEGTHSKSCDFIIGLWFLLRTNWLLLWILFIVIIYFLNFSRPLTFMCLNIFYFLSFIFSVSYLFIIYHLNYI